MKITKHGKVTISLENGRNKIEVSGFECDFSEYSAETPMAELAIYATKWAHGVLEDAMRHDSQKVGVK